MTVVVGAGAAAQRPAQGGVRVTTLALWTLVAVLTTDALDAYAIAGVPLSYFGCLAITFFTVWLGLRHRLYHVPGLSPLLALAVWTTAVTLVAAVAGDFPRQMPPLATTPYGVFLIVRFLMLASFIAVLLVTYWLCRRGEHEAIVRVVVLLGVIAACYGIYVYIAQTTGLPELLPRSRLGTNAREQATSFGGGLHRAMGSFREPSVLAEWLVLPLMLSFVYRQSLLDIRKLVIAFCLLLTGSLTGILAAAGGVGLALILTNPFRRQSLSMMLRMGVVGALGAAGFGYLAHGYDGVEVDLIKMIFERIEPILEYGMKGSSRGYIYEFIATHDIPILGIGVGNSSIMLSHETNSAAMSSFVSLYWQTAFSAGWPGAAMLALFMTAPLVAVTSRRFRNERETRWYLAAYIGWLLMAAVHSGEFRVQFAVCYALFAFVGFHRHADRTRRSCDAGEVR